MGWHAGGWRLDQVTTQNQPDDAPMSAVVEEPHAEQEASPMPSQEGWDNDTSLDAALQQWGVSFCRVHRVGYFCNGYSLVKCCRTGWGYGMCGSTVHPNRCGWRAGGAGVWHAGGWHAGGWHLDQVTEQDQPEDAPLDAVVEVPSAEQEASPVPAKDGWDKDIGLHASLQQWGVAFCKVHRVGSFCNHNTRVKCCRTVSGGFFVCGKTVHSKRCGWPSWRLDQITEQNATDDMPAGEPTGEPTGVPADVFPDETTGFDSLGPFDEVPSLEQEANPAPAKMGWENETELQAAAFNTWGQSFCRVHHVGTFCDGYTQVRCCRTSWGFEKCGSTVHSSRCGWNGGSVNGGWSGGSVNGGSAWHIHPGWRQSSFCRAHHTGYFCFSHRKVHCCNDHGHYVDCTTRSQTSWRC